MNARAAMISVLAGLFAAGCGVPGDGTVFGCVGSFSGTFAGSEAGVVTSTLFSSGKLISTFFTPGGNQMVTAMVAETGTIDAATGQLTITGTYNLEECTASGEWTRDTSSGTWSLEKH